MLPRANVDREVHIVEHATPPGVFYLGDTVELMPDLIKRYAGQVKLVYLDPPFLTGEKFDMHVRVGEKEWKSGKGSLLLTAYTDHLDREAYLAMMRAVLTGARALLREDGMIFLHIDERAHARLRLMMDEIFGEANFLNEIIWVYQTGGRARRYFSRKHDTILFYRKSPAYDFDPMAVAEPRAEVRRNHMKKHVDADGRVYRSVRSGGKIYTYYDDDVVPPGDVWADVSHLQQKDPQRTGFDTQKPLALLDRIVRCASRPGDLVADLFAGSGTTLESAYRAGRAFLGADVNPLSMQTARRRVLGAEATYHLRAFAGEPEIEASAVQGIAYYLFTLSRFEMEAGVCARAFSGLDAVDSWAAGYYQDGEFKVYAQETRTRKQPELTGQLNVPVYRGRLMIRVSDVTGRDFFARVEPSARAL